MYVCMHACMHVFMYVGMYIYIILVNLQLAVVSSIRKTSSATSFQAARRRCSAKRRAQSFRRHCRHTSRLRPRALVAQGPIH